MKRCWIAAGLLLYSVAGWAINDPGEFDLGPLASRYRDVNGDLRLKALGPFFERAVSTNDTRLWAARPLYSTVRDPVSQRRTSEYLWPLASTKQFKKEHSCRILLSFYTRFDVTDPKSRYRLWVLPLYFQGRDAQGEGYAAVFPLGGTIHEIFGRDRVMFVLFPLYARSAINQVRTTDVLWPIYSRSEGKGIYRFRVFPFYGKTKHRDKFDKRFILWPFWTSAKYYYPRSSGSGYVLFPLWGHIKLTDQEAWLIAPPLVRFSRGERMNYSYCPWPFFQKSEGEVEKLYLWPLWGQKRMKGYRSTFALWPIFRKERIDRGDVVVRRFVALPVVQAEKRVRRPEQKGGKAQVVGRYHKVWPLWSYQRDGDARRFRCVELWPLRNTGPVERSWAPLWTFYSRTAVGDALDHELLWGVYRFQRRGGDRCRMSLWPLWYWQRDDRIRAEREWSVLHGLLGYRREGTQKSFRVLYLLRFGGKEKKP